MYSASSLKIVVSIFGKHNLYLTSLFDGYNQTMNLNDELFSLDSSGAHLPPPKNRISNDDAN